MNTTKSKLTLIALITCCLSISDKIEADIVEIEYSETIVEEKWRYTYSLIVSTPNSYLWLQFDKPHILTGKEAFFITIRDWKGGKDKAEIHVAPEKETPKKLNKEMITKMEKITKIEMPEDIEDKYLSIDGFWKKKILEYYELLGGRLISHQKTVVPYRGQTNLVDSYVFQVTNTPENPAPRK
jgi:hypothetical protein